MLLHFTSQKDPIPASGYKRLPYHDPQKQLHVVFNLYPSSPARISLLCTAPNERAHCCTSAGPPRTAPQDRTAPAPLSANIGHPIETERILRVVQTRKRRRSGTGEDSDLEESSGSDFEFTDEEGELLVPVYEAQQGRLANLATCIRTAAYYPANPLQAPTLQATACPRLLTARPSRMTTASTAMTARCFR